MSTLRDLIANPPTLYHRKVYEKLAELTQQCYLRHDNISFHEAGDAVLTHVTKCNMLPEAMAKRLSLEAAYFGTAVLFFALCVYKEELRDVEQGYGDI